MPTEVDVDDLRRFPHEVVVDGEDVEASGLKGANYRADLGHEQDEVAHGHDLSFGGRLHEARPGTERECGLDLHAAGGHPEIGPGPAVAVDVARKELARSAEDLVDGLPGGLGGARRERAGRWDQDQRRCDQATRQTLHV